VQRIKTAAGDSFIPGNEGRIFLSLDTGKSSPSDLVIIKPSDNALLVISDPG